MNSTGWDLSPYDEIGRNDSPARVVIRIWPTQVWFWLTYYRIKRWLAR